VHNKLHLPLVVSLLTTLLTACQSPKQQDITEARLRPATEVPQLKVTAARCDGPLCDDFSVEALGNGFQLDFGNGVVVGDGDTPVTSTGDVTLELDVPAGFQFSAGQYHSLIAVTKDDPATRMVFTRRYAFEGSSEARTFTSQIDDPEVEETVDVTEGLWSPSCGDDARPVRLTVHLAATVEQMDFFQLQAYHGFFSPREGVQWRRCGDSEPIPPPTSGEGDDCGGGSRLECAAGLACEFDENQPIGTCVDPTEVLDPQPIDEHCGGLRATPCQRGLVCHYRKPGSREQQKIGFCKREVGLEGDVCRGVPDLPCADGLTCFAPSGFPTCVHATGELRSPCGDGLPD
jgi:hypothetical protein